MDRDRVLNECMRVLKPGGIFVLLENLPYNPVINLFRIYRRLTSRSLESTAYISSIRGYLTFSEVQSLSRGFSVFMRHEYHLLRMLTLGLIGRYPGAQWTHLLDQVVERMDAFLIARSPIASYFAWTTAILGKGRVARMGDPTPMCSRDMRRTKKVATCP